MKYIVSGFFKDNAFYLFVKIVHKPKEIVTFGTIYGYHQLTKNISISIFIYLLSKTVEEVPLHFGRD